MVFQFPIHLSDDGDDLPEPRLPHQPFPIMQVEIVSPPLTIFTDLFSFDLAHSMARPPPAGNFLQLRIAILLELFLVRK